MAVKKIRRPVERFFNKNWPKPGRIKEESDIEAELLFRVLSDVAINDYCEVQLNLNDRDTFGFLPVNSFELSIVNLLWQSLKH